MKKLSILAGVATLIAAAILPVASVSALVPTYSGNTSFTINREIRNVTNSVTNTFTYTITENEKPEGATVTGMPTVANVVFDDTEPFDDAALASNSVNISGVNFSKVGDYSFTVTETGTDDAVNYPIDTAHNSYTVYVLVRYELGAGNVPNNNAYTATMYIKNKEGNKVGQLNWSNAPERTYFELAATTTGDLAETDKCFAYTIDVQPGNGVKAGDVFAINSSTTCEGSASSVTAGTPATIYLMHGDSATIGQSNGLNQFPLAASVTITKTDTSDGYTTTMDGTERVTYTPALQSPGAQDFDPTIEIVNDKTADPFTGVFTNIWLYLVLLIIAVAGYIYFSRRSTEKQQ